MYKNYNISCVKTTVQDPRRNWEDAEQVEDYFLEDTEKLSEDNIDGFMGNY